MSVDLRFPNITGATPQERQSQLESYLHQFVEQLQWAFNNIDTVQNNGSYDVALKATSGSPSVRPSSQTIDALSTFATLKPIIIKSAEIVNSYYEQMKERFDGVYVADSDFGVYKETTAQEIKKTSEATDQAFTNIQIVESSLQGTRQELVDSIQATSGQVGQMGDKINSLQAGVDSRVGKLAGDIDALGEEIDANKSESEKELNDLKSALAATNKSIVDVSAYIRSGLLFTGEDEVAVYGIEVGQRNVVNGEEVFNKFARFTSGRLSFFDKNGTEVAFISDHKLYITEAEVTGSLIVGGYRMYSDNGLAFRWVG